MKKFLVILCLAFSLSSCGKDTHRFQNYPEIITKYQLEDLHDRAKWEVYKLNALYGPACLVNFESDSIAEKFYDIYLVEGNNLLKDKAEVLDIVGENNILLLLQAELVFFEGGSSEIFREGETVLSFFPKKEEGKHWHLNIGMLCYSIIFDKEGEILRYGCGDYMEVEYPLEDQKEDDKQFIQLLKEKKDSNPWLDWYLNRRKH
jgi:hypothetical protein